MFGKSPERRHWSSISRILAGTLGAYGFASLATVTLSLALARIGMDPAEAVTAATLASFAIFTAMAVTSFHARSARRAWAWLFGISAPLAIMIYLMIS